MIILNLNLLNNKKKSKLNCYTHKKLHNSKNLKVPYSSDLESALVSIVDDPNCKSTLYINNLCTGGCLLHNTRVIGSSFIDSETDALDKGQTKIFSGIGQLSPNGLMSLVPDHLKNSYNVSQYQEIINIHKDVADNSNRKHGLHRTRSKLITLKRLNFESPGNHPIVNSGLTNLKSFNESKAMKLVAEVAKSHSKISSIFVGAFFILEIGRKAHTYYNENSDSVKKVIDISTNEDYTDI